MRTTLTLDPDVARLVQAEAHRARRPVKQIVNEALRRGLAVPEHRPPKRYRVRPQAAKLLPGLDRGRLNALADELEDAVVLASGRKLP